MTRLCEKGKGGGGEGLLTHKRHVTRVFQRPWRIQHPEYDESDNGPDDGARRAVRQGVEADGPGEQMTTHNENLKDGLRPAHEFLEEPAHADRASQNLARVAETLHPRVPLAELAKHETRVPRHDAHEDGEDDSRHETDCGHHGWKREDA